MLLRLRLCQDLGETASQLDLQKDRAMGNMGFPADSDSKESACNAGYLGSVPGLGRPPGEGHSSPLQCSCLKNPHRQRNLASYSPWCHKVRHDWATRHSKGTVLEHLTLGRKRPPGERRERQLPTAPFYLNRVCPPKSWCILKHFEDA